MSIDIEKWLKDCEGYRPYPYKDTTGHLTVGYGRNLESHGISVDEATYMLRNDIKAVKQQLAQFEWYQMQPSDIQACLINMCYNLGLSKLLEFKRAIYQLGKRNYKAAAAELMNSRWAYQVGHRAAEIAEIVVKHAEENTNDKAIDTLVSKT